MDEFRLERSEDSVQVIIKLYGDLDLVTVTDDVGEAVRVILDYMRRTGPPETVAKAICV